MKDGDRAKLPERKRRPDRQDAQLASTREDSTLAEQILDDSPHPDVRADPDYAPPDDAAALPEDDVKR